MYVGIVVLPLIGSIMSGMMGSRLGRRGSEIIVQGGVYTSLLLCINGLYEIGLRRNEIRVKCYSWLESGMLDSVIGLRIDALSITMSCLVTGITGMVLLYSSEYMENDKGYVRYITYISSFSFFMLILVLADNMLLMFLGWEGVGIVSYLLISFWKESLEGNKSAIQAVMVNRIGDVSMLLGILTLYISYGTVSYDVLFTVVERSNMLILGGMLIIIGGMSKSAQIGLHTWLPNAMAAPTPISALLHAATMVTAGVYLFIRVSPLLECSKELLDGLVVIGGITLLVAGTIGLVMNDMKKVIAYSTGSQLGYMVLGCGLSSYKVAMYHLLNHGFFKALLFLSAGIVIHGISDEQDIRKAGGLKKVMPMAYAGFTIGSIALLGLPFLAGYYSKDVLLELAFMKGVQEGSIGSFGYIAGVLGAFCTAYYSVRLMSLIFITKATGMRSVMEGAYEGGLRMTIPIIILSIMSIFVGYITRDMFIGSGGDYWSNAIRVNNKFDGSIDSEFMDTITKLLPVILSLGGALLGLYGYIYGDRILFNIKKTEVGKKIYRFLSMKWMFDKIYNELIVQEILMISYNRTYKDIDKGVLEVLGPRGLNEKVLMPLGKIQTKVQTGNVYNYIFVTLVVLLILVVSVLI